ncbi:hypothetical protein DRO97_07910 [Archaeoglobales archaeon]|nr:MAG: hypothetical protein DRO97_07910 [Archaeoglobales archaeon]
MKNRMKIVNLRLDEEIIKKLDKISSKLLISRSELIRQSLTIYLTLLENLGFYFKPSIITNIDVYEERNAVNVDLGNMSSITIFVTSYSGIGELAYDGLKTDLSDVAEIMARQITIEALCRFVEPLAIMLSTSNSLDYSLKFLKLLKKEIKKYYNLRIIFTSHEQFFELNNTAVSCSTIGLRDLSIKNIPQRGDKVYLVGEVLNGEELLNNKDLAVDVETVKKLTERVKKGEINSIFPVKSDGVSEVVNYAASIAGGKAKYKANSKGCPATAVIVTTSREFKLNGYKEIGEIL